MPLPHGQSYGSVQQWVPVQGAPAGIAGPGFRLLLLPKPRVGQALSPGQAGWDVLGRGVLARAGACEALGSPGNSLWHRYENMSNKAVECKRYLQDQGVRVGCYFEQEELTQFKTFHVLINASVGGKTLEIPSKRMELQDLGTEWWGDPPLLCRAVDSQSSPVGSQLAAGPLGHAWGQPSSLGITCPLQ